MTCRDMSEFLDVYVAGGLAAAQVVSFEEHLAACASCRNYLSSYVETIRIGKHVLADHPDDSAAGAAVPEELVKAILAARARRP